MNLFVYVIKRTIEISSVPTRLSVAYSQLVIEREALPPATVPIEDVGVLIVDHPTVTYTQAVLSRLGEAGAVVILCDGRHLPASIMIPVVGNAVQTERQQAQITVSEPLRKRAWQAVVVAKIRMQALVLEEACGSDWGLRAMAARVRPGDVENLEAQAAQRYFPRLLGPGFRRHREGKPPNDLLNYGYMVLRAAVARAVVASGLLPSIGLFHSHRGNPFCLADDLLEPYRPLVDRKVAALAARGDGRDGIGREEKRLLLSVLNDVVPLTGGGKTPVSLAVSQGSASLARLFGDGKGLLVLPDGLPVEPDNVDDDP
ncbi:type II CRISPR-associated endonuclease Cas1 [Inquilinus sp. CA228]|uniref:type II CRISPR-associated endonuclease Cas1 n=1 Tax=Inquilinus sp. CA228 TaxID=3455609 RepID=UPI003F8D31A0